jgi:NADPH-dependent curcumin reductase CurA
METTALCSADSFNHVQELGVEDTIDYHQKDWFTQLNQKPKSLYLFISIKKNLLFFIF